MSCGTATPRLVVLVPCMDTEKFFETIIQRGQERGCMAKTFQYRIVRDGLRDCLIQQPEKLLLPYVKHACSFLILWDHDGSGAKTPEDGELLVRKKMVAAQVSERNLLAVALAPELEVILTTVYPRCRELLVELGRKAPPTDEEILRQTCVVLRKDHHKRKGNFFKRSFCEKLETTTHQS